MIRAVVVMNTQGKPRLVRFYEFQPPDKQKELIRSIYGVLSSRAENVLETSSEEVMRAVEEIARLEKSSNPISIVAKSVTDRIGRSS